MVAAREAATQRVPTSLQKGMSKTDFEQAKQKYNSAMRQTWRASVRVGDSVTQLVNKLVPPGFTVRPRDDLGSFVVRKGRDWIQSFAWTKLRGVNEALVLALNRAWEEHTKPTGTVPSAAVRRGIDSILTMPPLVIKKTDLRD